MACERRPSLDSRRARISNISGYIIRTRKGAQDVSVRIVWRSRSGQQRDDPRARLPHRHGGRLGRQERRHRHRLEDLRAHDGGGGLARAHGLRVSGVLVRARHDPHAGGGHEVHGRRRDAHGEPQPARVRRHQALEPGRDGLLRLTVGQDREARLIAGGSSSSPGTRSARGMSCRTCPRCTPGGY